jgi:membrane protein
LVAFLYLTAVAVVLCVEINVVRVDRLHPRSLLTPFTDNVSLTNADRRAYRTQAKTQRMKGFEDVNVHFEQRRSPADPGTGDSAAGHGRALDGPVPPDGNGPGGG